MSTRSKKKKTVLYPLIQQAVAFVNDELWKTLFDSLSKGDHPKRIAIDANSVKFFSKKDGFTYVYSSKTPKDIAIELRPLIANALCVYSENDLKEQNELKSEESREFRSACSADDWKKVKNKKMKDTLISDYVIRKKEELKLSWKTARTLYQIIIHAFYEYYTHKSSDIEMDKGEIIDIEDIVITPQVYNARVFYQNESGILSLLDDYEENVSHTKKKDLYHEWNKYLNFVHKRLEDVADEEAKQSDSEDDEN